MWDSPESKGRTMRHTGETFNPIPGVTTTCDDHGFRLSTEMREAA